MDASVAMPSVRVLTDVSTQRPARERTKAELRDKGPMFNAIRVKHNPEHSLPRRQTLKIRQTIVYLTREYNIFLIHIINFVI